MPIEKRKKRSPTTSGNTIFRSILLSTRSLCVLQTFKNIFNKTKTLNYFGFVYVVLFFFFFFLFINPLHFNTHLQLTMCYMLFIEQPKCFKIITEFFLFFFQPNSNYRQSKSFTPFKSLILPPTKVTH